VGAAGYRPLGVIESPLPEGGVAAQSAPLKPGTAVIYDPTSAVANARGFVQAPEINPIVEVSNLLAAGQAFAFSVKVLKAAAKEDKALLDIKA
jgi:flagellar basal body rod protein FlgC